MKVLSLRENAAAVIKDGAFLFNGVAGSEFLNTRRTTPMLPPKRDLQVKADTIYKIYTGIAYENPTGQLPDVRPTTPYWRSHGVRVERVEFEESAPGVHELIVYITATIEFILKPMEPMFESFSLGKLENVELYTGELPTKAEGFVPVAKRTILDASARKNGEMPAAGGSAGDLSDEDKRRKMDEWLNTPDDKPQSTAPGAPTGQIPASVPTTPGAEGAVWDSKGGGGVRTASPTST